MTHVQQLASEVWLITAQVIQTWQRGLSETKIPNKLLCWTFSFHGRVSTSYGPKAPGGEISPLFLCVTLWGATPFNGLYREAPPERVTFFRRQVYERVRISLCEVMKG